MKIKSNKIKTRFAPSPTGKMHIGNIRIAFFNYLLNKKLNGKFFLRIEDTDKNRNSKKFVNSIIKDLNWINIKYNKKIVFQSKRNYIYNKYYELLLNNNLAYFCFCSNEKLKEEKKESIKNKKPYKYSNTCKNLSKEEIEKNFKNKIIPSIRISVNDKDHIEFFDIIKGKQTFNTSIIGDFIIKRSDGSPSFIFSNIIDDIEMKITHIIRGEDHLTNTLRQLIILKNFKKNQPIYCHIPLIVNENNKPLSKREKGISIESLRKKGFFPESIINYIFRLGYNCNNSNIININDIHNIFDTKNISKSATKYSYNNLLYWQKKIIKEMNPKKLKSKIKNIKFNLIPKNKINIFLKTIKNNITFIKEIKKWEKCLFSENIKYNKNLILKIDKNYIEYIKNIVKKSKKEDIEKNAIKYNANIKKIYMQLRIIFTGKENGPEIKKIIKIMKKKTIFLRINQLNKLIKKNDKNIRFINK